MPIYDYRCSACGHEEKDLYFAIAALPKKRPCASCGKRKSTQDFRGERLAQITSASSMYGIEQPGTGVVFENYEHKKRWLKENNMMETNDPIGGSRCKRKEPPPRVDPPAEWIDLPQAAHL
jgi:putative FmdB family regulatory protein